MKAETSNARHFILLPVIHRQVTEPDARDVNVVCSTSYDKYSMTMGGGEETWLCQSKTTYHMQYCSTRASTLNQIIRWI